MCAGGLHSVSHGMVHVDPSISSDSVAITASWLSRNWLLRGFSWIFRLPAIVVLQAYRSTPAQITKNPVQTDTEPGNNWGLRFFEVCNSANLKFWRIFNVLNRHFWRQRSPIHAFNLGRNRSDWEDVSDQLVRVFVLRLHGKHIFWLQW